MSAIANYDPTYYTFAEYLALEEQADYKSEYYQGHIIAMAGASFKHNQIVRNTLLQLHLALSRRDCEALASDLRVWIEAKRRGTYPDVVVICGQPQFFEERTDTITNPQVVIEVLSESTEKYDRKEKFHAYWTLDSLKEYVLIDQSQPRVEYFRRVSPKQWELLIFTELNDILALKSLDITLTLSQIYQNITWNE